MSTPDGRRLDPLAIAIATVGGIGRIRPAPGTWGSLVAALAAGGVIAGAGAGWRPLLGSALVVVTALGWWASGRAAPRLGGGDPASIVVDEVAGMWLAVLVLPGALVAARPLAAVLTAFLAFRLFDIEKPFPVSSCDAWKGAVGIMGDDLAAGLLGGLLTMTLLH